MSAHVWVVEYRVHPDGEWEPEPATACATRAGAKYCFQKGRANRLYRADYRIRKYERAK